MARLASHTPAHKDAARLKEQAPAAGAGAHGARSPGDAAATATAGTRSRSPWLPAAAYPGPQPELPARDAGMQEREEGTRVPEAEPVITRPRSIMGLVVHLVQKRVARGRRTSRTGTLIR